MKSIYVLATLLISNFSVAQEQNRPSEEVNSTPMSTELFNLVDRWQSKQRPGENLLSYVSQHADSQATLTEARELADYFNTRITQQRGDDRDVECACEVRYSYTSSGTDYNYQTHTQINESNEKSFLFASRMNGVAHSADLTRYIQHADNDLDDQRSDYAQVASQIICMAEDSQNCSAGSCRGDFNFEVDYLSQEHVYTETSGGILVGAHSVSSDVAKLTYDSTYSPAEVLFNKGIMLQKTEEADFNPDALLSLLEGILGIVAVVAGEDFSWADLDADMTSNVVTGLLGLYSNDGSAGSINKNYIASYNSLTEPPHNIYPGNAGILRLESTGRVHGRGWGGWKSWSKAKYGSSYSMAGTVNNYICDAGVTPPNENAFWNYGDMNGPISIETLISNVTNYLTFMIPGFDKQELVSVASHYDYMDYDYPVEITAESVRIKNRHSQCMYPYGWGDLSTVRFHNWVCWPSDTMAFEIVDAGLPNEVLLKSQEVNLCLTPVSSADYDKMKAGSCAASDAVYIMTDIVGDEFKLKNKNNNKCLYGTDTDGGHIRQFGCWNNPDMVFSFENY